MIESGTAREDLPAFDLVLESLREPWDSIDDGGSGHPLGLGLDVCGEIRE
jgi:hypothetical protein